MTNPIYMFRFTLFGLVNKKSWLHLCAFFQNLTGKTRVGLATRDEPMIYPWQTHDYPVTTPDISQKTRVFRGNPGYVQPVIYPWQTRDLPVTTRDFFTGSNLPPCIRKYRGKCFFSWKNGIPWDDQFERFACSVDSSNFSAIVGWP